MKDLGSIVTFHNPEQAKIQHRMRAAWSASTHHRHEITSTNFPTARQAQIIRTNYHTLHFLFRRYLVHHEQDSKTNTLDTKEDAVTIIYSRSTFKKKAETECEEDITDSNKDQDSLRNGLNSSKKSTREADATIKKPCRKLARHLAKITMATSRKSCNATHNKMNEESNQLGSEHDLTTQRLPTLPCYSALKKTTTGKER